MAGMFDDLIPAGAKSDAPSHAGMFDDLVPNKESDKRTSSPAAYMAIDLANQVSAASQRTTPHIDAYKGKLLSKETFEDDAGNVLFRDPSTGQVIPTDKSRHIALRDPNDNTVKVYSRDEATNENPGVGLARVLSSGLAAGAPTARASLSAASAMATPGAEVAAAGKRLGVDLPRAVTSDSGDVQQLGKIITNIPLAGGPLRKASAAAVDDLGSSALAARDAYGSGNPATAGAAVRSGIEENLKSGPIKTRVGELYDRVDGFVDPTTTGGMPNTKNLVNTINARRVNAALPESAATKDLSEALARPSGMNYEGIKDLRTYYGEMLDGGTPIPQGMSHGEVKQIYGALSNDMRLIIAKAGGADGLRAYQQAESAAKRWSGIREDLSSLLKVKSEEGMFEKIGAMAGSSSRADINMLGRVRGAVGPQNWDEVAAAVIGKMGWPAGGTGFSPDAFLTAYKKLSEEGKRMLFRSTNSASHAEAIDDIAKVSERFKQLNKYANPSGPGQTVAGGAELYAAAKAVPAAFAGGWIEPVSLVGSIVGGRITSHILARPMTARAMAKWSESYAQAAANPTPAKVAAFETSTKLFASTVGRDFGRPDLVPDLMRRLQGAVPSAANQEQPESPRVGGDQP